MVDSGALLQFSFQKMLASFFRRFLVYFASTSVLDQTFLYRRVYFSNEWTPISTESIEPTQFTLIHRVSSWPRPRSEYVLNDHYEFEGKMVKFSDALSESAYHFHLSNHRGVIMTRQFQILRAGSFDHEGRVIDGANIQLRADGAVFVNVHVSDNGYASAAQLIVNAYSKVTGRKLATGTQRISRHRLLSKSDRILTFTLRSADIQKDSYVEILSSDGWFTKKRLLYRLNLDSQSPLDD